MGTSRSDNSRNDTKPPSLSQLLTSGLPALKFSSAIEFKEKDEYEKNVTTLKTKLTQASNSNSKHLLFYKKLLERAIKIANKARSAEDLKILSLYLKILQETNSNNEDKLFIRWLDKSLDKLSTIEGKDEESFLDEFEKNKQFVKDFSKKRSTLLSTATKVTSSEGADAKDVQALLQTWITFYEEISTESFEVLEDEKQQDALLQTCDDAEQAFLRPVADVTATLQKLIKDKEPHVSQGMHMLTQDPRELTVRTTTLLKFSRGEKLPACLDEKQRLYVIAAAKKRIRDLKKVDGPKVGDIVFFDGENNGHPVIKIGNETRVGIPGTGRYTHVAIIVSIDANGTALIAETGGAGIEFMRQATIRHLQTGTIFRPKDPEFKRAIAQIAFDTTKFSAGSYLREKILEKLKTYKDKDYKNENLNNIINEVVDEIYKVLPENSLRKEEKESLKEKAQAAVKAKLKEHQEIKEDKLGVYPILLNTLAEVFTEKMEAPGKHGHILPSGDYKVAEMLGSPLSEALNKIRQKPLFTEERYENRHAPIFGGHFTKRWCSSFAATVIVNAFAERLKEMYPRLTTKDCIGHIERCIAEPSGLKEYDLLNLAPKTLYQILLNARDEHGNLLFAKQGSFINFDDRGPEIEEKSKPQKIESSEEKVSPQSVEPKKHKKVVNYKYNMGSTNAKGKPSKAANPFAKDVNFFDPKKIVDDPTQFLSGQNSQEDEEFLNYKNYIINKIKELQKLTQKKFLENKSEEIFNTHNELCILMRNVVNSTSKDEILLLIVESLNKFDKSLADKLKNIAFSDAPKEINEPEKTKDLIELEDQKKQLLSRIGQQRLAVQKELIIDESHNLSFKKIKFYEQLTFLYEKINSIRIDANELANAEMFNALAEAYIESLHRKLKKEATKLFISLFDHLKAINKTLPLETSKDTKKEEKKVATPTFPSTTAPKVLQENSKSYDLLLLEALKERACYIDSYVDNTARENSMYRKRAHVFARMISLTKNAWEAVDLYKEFLEQGKKEFLVKHPPRPGQLPIVSEFPRFIGFLNKQSSTSDFNYLLAQTLKESPIEIEKSNEDNYRSQLVHLKDKENPNTLWGSLHNMLTYWRSMSQAKKFLLGALVTGISVALAFTVIGAVIEFSVLLAFFSTVGVLLSAKGIAATISGTLACVGLAGIIGGVTVADSPCEIRKKLDLPQPQPLQSPASFHTSPPVPTTTGSNTSDIQAKFIAEPPTLDTDEKKINPLTPNASPPTPPSVVLDVEHPTVRSEGAQDAVQTPKPSIPPEEKEDPSPDQSSDYDLRKNPLGAWLLQVPGDPEPSVKPDRDYSKRFL